LKQKAESEQKLLIEKINDQGAKIKQLASRLGMEGAIDT